jgi:hypothetical protein
MNLHSSTSKIKIMIPALLYLLFKRLRKNGHSSNPIKNFFRSLTGSHRLMFGLLILLLLISVVLSAQKLSRSYKVIRSGNEIGWLTVEKQTDSNATTITMATKVHFRFILAYESFARETSQFVNGTLQHSYYYRKTNGSIKADRHTYLVGNDYEVAENPARRKLNISPVTYNSLCMYFQEPVGLKQVYSDNHQKFLEIEKKPDGGYCVSQPDGITNTFYYSGGTCYKVKINHSFYSATLLLK